MANGMGWKVHPLNVHDDNGNRGLTDTNNHLYIPIKYRYCNNSNTLTSKNPWHKPVLITMQNDKMGIIDTLGNVLIPFEYQSIRFDSGSKEIPGFIVAQKEPGTGIIDTNNRVVLPFTHEMIWCANAYIVATINGKYGIMDRDMKELIPFSYDLIKLIDNEFRLFKSPHPGAGEKFIVYMESIDAITLKSLTPSKEVDNEVYWEAIGLPRRNPDGCGYGRHMAAQIEAFQKEYELGRPKIVITGKQETDFRIDTIQWASQNYELPFTRQLPLLGRNAKGEYSAIIDQQKHYLVKPLPGPMKAITYNTADSLIAVYMEDQKGQLLYGLLDGHFNEVFPLQPKRIISGFRWKGKVFAEVLDGNFPINENKNFNMRGNHVFFQQLRPTRIINSDTQTILPGGYKFIKMAGEGGNTDQEYDKHFLLVANQNGFIGIINPDGEVLFPKISFKYKDIIGKGDGIFFVKTCTTDSNSKEKCDYMYVDEHGKKMFPKILINNIQPTDYPGLYAVEYWNNGVRAFYYNKNGLAYTSARLE